MCKSRIYSVLKLLTTANTLALYLLYSFVIYLLAVYYKIHYKSYVRCYWPGYSLHSPKKGKEKQYKEIDFSTQFAIIHSIYINTYINVYASISIIDFIFNLFFLFCFLLSYSFACLSAFVCEWQTNEIFWSFWSLLSFWPFVMCSILSIDYYGWCAGTFFHLTSFLVSLWGYWNPHSVVIRLPATNEVNTNRWCIFSFKGFLGNLVSADVAVKKDHVFQNAFTPVISSVLH